MHILSCLAFIELTDLALPTPVALAAVATIGYLLGVRNRDKERQAGEAQGRRELKRAHEVAKELERIAEQVRRGIASHQASVMKFKDKVGSLGGDQDQGQWQELCAEAENMLKPTLKLAAQLATAYDEIRQQSNNLMTFTEVRTDPLTGVSNRRALDDTMETMVNMFQRYQQPFTVAIIDIDHFKQLNDEQGHLYGDRMLKALARVLDETVRNTDMVARYGGEEFVVVMPQTSLEGASIFAERLRMRVEQELPLTISGGTAEVSDGDDAHTLLSRADAALYSAKAAGRNRFCRHLGTTIEPVPPLTDEELAPAVNVAASA